MALAQAALGAVEGGQTVHEFGYQGAPRADALLGRGGEMDRLYGNGQATADREDAEEALCAAHTIGVQPARGVVVL